MPLRPYRLKASALEELSQLLSARRLLSLSLASLCQQAAVRPAVRPVLAPAIEALAQQLKALDRQIAQHTAQLPACAQLVAVPGIGPVAAGALAVRLLSSEFSSYDQFIAYVGLDLTVRDSGLLRGKRTVSHQGDAELRRLLYLCAQASIRTKGSPFTMQYQRELAKGLAKSRARCAVARKLARLAWALVRRGAEYDPARVYQRPKP